MADHDDQDDETPGTSSSRAFAELPNPKLLATPMLTRSQRVERFTTPLQSNAPFNPALTRIAEENECRASRPSPSQNLSPGGGPDFGNDDEAGDDYHQARRATLKSVDKILFEKTSTSYIDKISNKTKDCFKKWEALKSIIEICDLMTLFKGFRVKPIPTAANPRGYTDGYDVLHQGRNYNIGPNDISKYNWDTRRLYPLLDAAFDRSAWHSSQLGFSNHDAILIFDDMEKHFEGRDA
jgi:hypothetical protein